jgi:hypothetical protein
LEETSVSHDAGRDSLRKVEVYFILIWLMPKSSLNKDCIADCSDVEIVWNEIHVLGLHITESCYRAELGVMVIDLEVYIFT